MRSEKKKKKNIDATKLDQAEERGRGGVQKVDDRTGDLDRRVAGMDVLD